MKAIAALLLAIAGVGAQAQTIYRCGNEYTRIPCPQGKILEATDSRTGAQRAEARRVAAEEESQAAAMKRERLAAQAAEKPALAGRIGPAPAPLAKPASGAGRSRIEARRTHPLANPKGSTPFTAVDGPGNDGRKRR